jgi:hypothetical protein
LIQLSGLFGPTKNQNEIFAFNEAKVCQTGTARRFRELFHAQPRRPAGVFAELVESTVRKKCVIRAVVDPRRRECRLKRTSS